MALRALPGEAFPQVRKELQAQRQAVIAAQAPRALRPGLRFWLGAPLAEALEAARPLHVELAGAPAPPASRGSERAYEAEAEEARRGEGDSAEPARRGFRLARGGELPAIGLGTGIFSVSKEDVAGIVALAARLGYRHFDCAQAYGTEAAVGEGLARSGVPREAYYYISI